MADPIADFMDAMLYTIKNPKAVENLRAAKAEHDKAKADADAAIQQSKSNRAALNDQIEKFVQDKKAHGLDVARLEHDKAELSKRELSLQRAEAMAHAQNADVNARMGNLVNREGALQQWEERVKAMQAAAEKLKAEFEEKLAKLRQLV